MSYTPPAAVFINNTSPTPSGAGLGPPLDAGFFNTLVAGVDDADTRVTDAETRITRVESAVPLSAKSYGAVGDGVADDTAALQAWLNAVPTGGRGILPPGRYRITSTLTVQPSTAKTNLLIAGSGNIGQSTPVGLGASVIDVDGAFVGLTVGSTTSTQFQGIMLRNLHFHDKNGTATGGVVLLRQNNFVLENVGCSDFTAGFGIHSDGTPNVNQYGQLLNPSLNNCMVGYKNTASNGVRMFGGMIDANANAGTPAVGRTGIEIVSGDNFRSFGTVLQFCSTAVKLTQGEAHELHGPRVEGCTTGVIVDAAAISAKIVGGYFNNYISGGTGTAIDINAAATKTMLIAPYIIAVTTRVNDLAADTTSIIDNQIILKSNGGFLQLGDAKMIRNTLGQIMVLDNLNANIHMTVGRGNNTPGGGRLFFGSAQDAGLQRSAAKVTSPNPGTVTALGTFSTATRLAAAAVGVGAAYFDTTLSKPVWSDGTNWRDAVGTIV